MWKAKNESAALRSLLVSLVLSATLGRVASLHWDLCARGKVRETLWKVLEHLLTYGLRVFALFLAVIAAAKR